MSRELDDWIATYMSYTKNTEPPYLFRKWMAVSTIASALQRKCFLPWGSLTFYPNMYIILVAPSGKARKGTAMNPALEIQREVTGIKLAAEAITREALIRELSNANENEINPTTGEMVFHSSLTVHSQELTVFLGYRNLSLMSDLADWYDCRSEWTYRTKHQGTDNITGVWLNLVGATTPELIRSSMSLDAIGLGLTARMVFVYEPKRARPVPDPFLSKEELEMRVKLIEDLERIWYLQGHFTVTDEFVSFWAQWYVAQDENPPFKDHRFNGYFERRPAQAMKLAIIHNAARTDSMVIGLDDLQAGIKLLEDTELKMPNTFRGVGKSSQADLVSRVMVELGQKHEMTFSELMTIFYSDSSEWDMENVLKSLEAMKFLERHVPSGKIIYRPEHDHTFVRNLNRVTSEEEEDI